MEEISKSIWETAPWCMIFADDIVQVAETRKEVSDKLDEWREALKGKGLRINRRPSICIVTLVVHHL